MQPGRRRDPDLDEAIRATARHLLTQDGGSFTALTMEAVAAQAGAAKPSVYLRYPAKADLVLTVIREDAAEFTAPARAGLAPLLEAIYDWAALSFGTPSARAGLAGVIAARTADQQLLTSDIVADYDQMQVLLERLKDCGEIRADLDLKAALDALLWTILVRACVLHQALDVEFRRQYLDVAARSLRK